MSLVLMPISFTLLLIAGLWPASVASVGSTPSCDPRLLPFVLPGCPRRYILMGTAHMMEGRGTLAGGYVAGDLYDQLDTWHGGRPVGRQRATMLYHTLRVWWVDEVTLIVIGNHAPTAPPLCDGTNDIG